MRVPDLPIHFRIAAVVACLQAASFILVTLSAGVPIPIIDSLKMTGSYLQDGFSWQWLTQLVNQHSVIVPRLLLLADLELTGGHMMAFVALSLLAWCGVFILLWRRIVAVAPDDLTRILAASLLALVMYRGFLLESIVLNNGFNYPLTAFFAVLAAVPAANLSPGRPALAGASLSAVAALAAGLCLLNGVLALPLAALVAWLRSRSTLVFIPFALAAFCAFILYRMGAGLSADHIHIEFDVVLRSLLNLFGAPWVLKIDIAGKAVGLLVLLMAAISLWMIMRRGDSPTAGDAIAAMLILFGIGSSVMVAVGRPDISDKIGAAGRYGLWVAFVHAGIILAQMRNPAIVTWTRGKAFRAMLLVGLLLTSAEQARLTLFYARWGGEMQVAAAALRSGDYSSERLAAILTTTGVIPTLDAYAERNLYGFRKSGQ